MSDRRVLLGTSAVLVGLGSALISGTAVAGADTGEADARSDTASGAGSGPGAGLSSAGSAASAPASSPAATPRRAATRAARTGAGPAATAPDGNTPAPRTGRPGIRSANIPVVGDTAPTTVAQNDTVPAKADPKPAAAVPVAARSVDAPAVPAVAVAPDIDTGTAPAPTAAPALVEVTAAPAAPVAYAAPAPAPAPAPASAGSLLATALADLGWQPAGGLAVAVPALAAFSGQRQSAAPAAVIGTPVTAADPPTPGPVGEAPVGAAAADAALAGEAAPDAALVGQAAAALLPALPNGVTGVQVGHSRLAIPGAFIGQTVAADWYFPTQVDGSVDAQGVIWLQHGFGATNTFYSALATELAQTTNSIVVAPTLSSIPFTFSGGCLICDTTQEAAAAAFLDPDRTALIDSALAAGYTGDVEELKGRFVLSGHSAGGGFATAVAADYIGEGSEAQDANLVGVVMFDGVSNGAFDGSFTTEVQSLGAAGKPIYQIAAPAQAWNAFGATTGALWNALPDTFVGAVLNGGSHVDSMLGVNPLFDFVLQLVTGPVPAGNTDAAYTLSTGWINDMYGGLGPETDTRYGFYAGANEQILMGPTAAVALPSPFANQLSFGDNLLRTLISPILNLFGVQFPTNPITPGATNGVTGLTPSTLTNGVTGVKTGSAVLEIPAGDYGYAAPADWYFPTQADGTVQANGVIWLQHGFLGFNSWYADMAQALAQETNSIVVAPNIFWFDTPLCPGCFLGGEVMREAVATMFEGSRSALNVSANTAGLQGTLPEQFILTGHSAGGNFATAVGALVTETDQVDNLLGVVMFDGVSRAPLFTDSLTALTNAGIPDYQIAAPPQRWNAWGVATELMYEFFGDQFYGVQIDNGSHTDVIGGDSLFGWLGELGSDLIVRPSPPGGKAAVRAFATGWVNDIYSGIYGPDNPGYGIYGNPNDGTYVGNQAIVMGQAGATTLPAPPPVVVDPDLPPTENYLGTWYEQGSVKQFFSIGLVNTKAVYSLNDDGSIKVQNSGNYFGPNGPESNITGSAVPVNAFNTRLNVGFFFGEPSSAEPGNYWILDYAPDYSWAIVSDSSGRSGFILTRDQVIPEAEYNDLVARAQQLGVSGNITPTAQFPTIESGAASGPATLPVTLPATLPAAVTV